MADRGHGPTDRKTGDAASAADHLANERTFLAWMRTAVGLLAVGIVVDKFTLFTQAHGGAPGRGHAGVAVGAALIVFGGVVAVFAIGHYLSVRRDLLRGRARPSPSLALAVGAGIVLAAALLAAFVLRG